MHTGTVFSQGRREFIQVQTALVAGDIVIYDIMIYDTDTFLKDNVAPVTCPRQ